MVISLYLKYFIIFTFLICYFFVIIEEKFFIKKNTVVIFFSSLIWFLIYIFNFKKFDVINNFLSHLIFEYCQMFLFVLVAMIYINSLKYFKFLNYIKYFFFKKEISYRRFFLIIGFASFFMSPIADNLTTALLMSSIVLSIDSNDKKFINLNFINIIVASNAGGAFCPFGDITTLMIWQKGVIDFFYFFYLFIPSIISFLIPMLFMLFYLPKKKVFNLCEKNSFTLDFEGKVVFYLFIFTLVITIIFQTFFKLPTFIGMMFGYSVLQIFEKTKYNTKGSFIFKQLCSVEWDTLFFFYGIILSVGSLGFIGFLDTVSSFIYFDMISYLSLDVRQYLANFFVGLLSSFIDNVPITYAILSMNPIMSKGQWLLVTYAAAVGGSLLSIGSAAGIVVMGKSNHYTFFSHLKYIFFIFLGYVVGFLSHIYLNNRLFFIY